MKYIASNEPLTSTAENDIVSGLWLVLPEDVVRFWKKNHPKHEWTDDEAISSYMAVHDAWWWDVPDAMPGSKPSPVEEK